MSAIVASISPKLLDLDFKFGTRLSMGNAERTHTKFSLKVCVA